MAGEQGVQPDPVTAAVLVNPLSLRNRRGRLAEKVLDRARMAGIPAREAVCPDQLQRALAELLDTRPEVLVIVGGDGTIQALVTQLLRRDSTDRPPPLCLVRGGRTNLTANDVNRRHRLMKGLDRVFREGPRAGTIVTRPVMEIRAGEQAPEYGFFIAGAIVDQIIRETHQYHRSSSNGDGRLGTPLQVTRRVISHLTGRNRLPAFKAHVRAGDLGEFERPVRILLATSLRRISKGIDPFADRGKGRLQFTAIASGTPHLWRRLPGLLRGQLPAQANARSGYISGMSNEIRVAGLESYCLDGEYLDLKPGAQLNIRTGPDIRFLVI